LRSKVTITLNLLSEVEKGTGMGDRWWHSEIVTLLVNHRVPKRYYNTCFGATTPFSKKLKNNISKNRFWNPLEITFTFSYCSITSAIDIWFWWCFKKTWKYIQICCKNNHNNVLFLQYLAQSKKQHLHIVNHRVPSSVCCSTVFGTTSFSQEVKNNISKNCDDIHP